MKSELRARVEQQWQELPAHFRLPGSLKDSECSPFERDFLAGTRLDYLHTLLLLGLVTQKRASDVDKALLEVASEMLSITVQVVILRDRLVNSGTCLIWKVCLCRSNCRLSLFLMIIIGRTVWSTSGGDCLIGLVASDNHRLYTISTVEDNSRLKRTCSRNHARSMDPTGGAQLRPLQPGYSNNPQPVGFSDGMESTAGATRARQLRC